MTFKMTVEDVFVIRNRGVVATGRVESGGLRVGDTVHINSGAAVRVDGIEMFRKSIDEARTGANIGVLFRDIEKSQLDRGAVLTAPGGASDAGSSAFIV
jgi:translation elongation factor EF-Tu-like GTPase